MAWTTEEQREHRRLWVDALRSGKYRQATKQLRSGDAFCCLGVACDISGLDRWRSAEMPFYLHENRMLPAEVQKWLGLSGKLGGYGVRIRTYLADLNDSGKSFAEIADIIESEPDGLLHPSPEAA